MTLSIRAIGGVLSAFLLLVAALSPLWAQESQPSQPADVTSVVIDGRPLFEVSGVSGFDAVTRAEGIESRILEIARRPSDDPVSMTINVEDLGHRILADGRNIMVVTDFDAQREGINDTNILAWVYSARIEEAIERAHQDRSREALGQGLIKVLAWTLAFALFVALLFWVRRRMRVWSDRAVDRYMSGVEEATQAIVRSRAVAEVVAVAGQGLLVLLLLIAFYYYVSVVLFSFAQTRTIATVLLNHVSDPVFNALRATLNYIPSLVVLIIIFFITRYLVRLARVTFENIEAGTVRLRGFQRHWVWPTFNIIRAVLIISAIVLAYPYFPGSDSAAFQGLSILLGLMVSIGSNSVVSNILAGFFVIYRQSTSVGDIIKTGDHIGEVTTIKLTETHLRSYKNELVSIPNAQLLNSEVVNYSRITDNNGLIIHTTVGIGYDEHHSKIEALLLEAVARTNGLKASPPPFVLRTALGDFAVSYEVNAYANRKVRIPRVESDLRTNILDALHEAGVQIMSPHYEGDPKSAKIPAAPASDESAQQA